MNEKPNFKNNLISREIENSSIVKRNGNTEIRLPVGMNIFIPNASYDPGKREQVEKLSLKLSSVLAKYELAKGRIKNISYGNTHDDFDESLITKKTELPINNIVNEIDRINKELKQLGVEKITGNLKWPMETELQE